MKRLETVLFVMDSIRKITLRRSNERQFDKGIGAFHVRSPERLVDRGNQVGMLKYSVHIDECAYKLT